MKEFLIIFGTGIIALMFALWFLSNWTECTREGGLYLRGPFTSFECYDAKVLK